MNSRNRKAKTLANSLVGAAQECLGAEPISEAEHQRMLEAERQRILAQVGAVVSTLAPNLHVVFDQFQAQIYTAMQANGFWDYNQRDTGTKIALMHSELSEALEADRKDIQSDDKIPEFTGVEAELADTVIRILDFAGRHNLRLGEAVTAKMLFNLTRPPKHGKAY